jgi:hypothetical protein
MSGVNLLPLVLLFRVRTVGIPALRETACIPPPQPRRMAIKRQ